MSGILHFEDLSKIKQVEALSLLETFDVTEKIDGTALYFGLDENGLFTSYKTKDSKRIYNISQYELRSTNNSLAAAHSALFSISTELKSILSIGDIIQTEVLFGCQPNAIIYGANTIVLIGQIAGNPASFDRIVTKFENRILKSSSIVIESHDGISIEKTLTDHTWIIKSIPRKRIISPISIDEINQLQQTTHDERILIITRIKEKLLDALVRNITPALRTVTVNEQNNIGIEGLVFTNNTDLTFKLIDKSVFSVINQFNHYIRNQIKQTIRFNFEKNKHVYKEFNVITKPLDHSLYDNLLMNISTLISMPQLNKRMTLKRTINQYDTVDDFINSWQYKPFNVLCLQIKIAIDHAIAEYHNMLMSTVNNWNALSLTLNSGKHIIYTAEIQKRTLVAFAEYYTDLLLLYDAVEKSQELKELAHALYGKYLTQLKQ